MTHFLHRPVMIFAALAGLMATPAAHADDEQLWTSANVTVKLSDAWRIQNETTFRFSEDRDGLYEIENNTLLGYRVADNVTVWAGYTHNPQYASGDFTVMEHRGREQVTFDNIVKLGRVAFNARLRLEQRWREGIDGTAWRVRPFVRASLPLYPGSTTSLNVSHESFVDLNSTNFQRVRGEERMRNAVFVATPVVKNVNAEIGYLWQHGFVEDQADTNDHVLNLALALDF